MGSLLSVIAVTVTANAPAAAEDAAVRVRTERPPMSRRQQRRFQQRSGMNAKRFSPPKMSGDSASRLCIIRCSGNISFRAETTLTRA